jgi:DNA polymerase (family 10)
MRLKINEYGICRIKDNQWIAGKTEEEMYQQLNFEFIPPEMRENQGEIELASLHKIPKLIELADILGDMQMHSMWSDGTMELEELAKFVLDHFQYDYIVMTDHSKSQRIAGGMSESKLLDQIQEIKKVNLKLGKNFLKAGIEVDILPDGTLDFSNDILKELDWVCASIHIGFLTDNTNRLLAACKNPLVHSIGHPTGRLIGKRNGYHVDWEKVFALAAQTGTSLEINAQSDRLDLNAKLAKQAKESGVTLVINTDSHNQKNFSQMAFGVWIARRAWCTKKDILNSKTWKEIQKFTDRKKALSL